MSSETTTQKTSPLLIILIIISLLLASLVAYLYFTGTKEIHNLEIEKKQLEAKFNTTTKDLEEKLDQAEDTVTELSDMLLLTKDELEEIEDDLRDEKNRNEDFEDQIKDLTGTVKDLDKLSKTDEELLQKYSRTYFLNENFVPLKLKKIDDKYVLSGKKDQYFHGDAIDFLEELLDDAKRAGHNIKIVSAYRSFDEQSQLKGQYTQVYGTGANAFSADQGYSEHQLGTTLDLVDADNGATTASFASTDAYKWLTKNAYRYGFILSYPENNDFYVFEPWHWRFVGTDLARDLHRDDAEFYEWEQRKIDGYLIKIFD